MRPTRQPIRRSLARRAGIAALCLGLAACSQAIGPSFYLLDSAPLPAAETRPSSGPVIGMREISLPLYARRPQIALLGPGGVVTLSDNHRWAEEMPRAASRIVARKLTADLGQPVVVEPWPTGVAPDYRLEVEVDYFIGSPGGELRLDGQYRSAAVNAPAKAVTRPFEIRVPVAGGAEDEYTALVAAHAEALNQLADLIVGDLRALTK
ncbi:membrane integrity-associated transporter subunit PqiC [Rhodobacteraceae bacterium NNCM2]|nr:membrane integrity-associated transporter subunit PqiC [Coraliihabitans acroporae]